MRTWGSLKEGAERCVDGRRNEDPTTTTIATKRCLCLQQLLHGPSLQPHVFPDPTFRFWTSHAAFWARDLLHYQGDVMGSWQSGHLLASLAFLELPDPSLGPDLWKQCSPCSHLLAQPTAAWANLCPLICHPMFLKHHRLVIKYLYGP